MFNIFNPKWWTMKAELKDLIDEYDKQQYSDKLDQLALDITCIHLADQGYNQKRLDAIKHNMRMLGTEIYIANRFTLQHARMTFKLVNDELIIIKG